MHKGFYAVRVGRNIGVYNTWDECQNQTRGYPNARYKRFNTLKEAEDFVNHSFSSISLPSQESNSDAGDLRVVKKQKRAHAEIEDESGWDVVYSDGACKGNGTVSSVAGVGVWWGHEDPRNIAERCPGDQTNNRAELIAILRVLETSPLSKRPLLIKTDSQYSIDCFDKWIQTWKGNNWKTSSGRRVKNEGIIRCIDSHLAVRSKSGQKVRLQHVKGHSGEVGNEGADRLANLGTLGPPAQERDWMGLEAQLEIELNNLDPNIALVEVQGCIDIAEPISVNRHPKSRNLEDAVAPFHNRLDRTSACTPELKAASSASSLTSPLIPCHKLYPKLQIEQEQTRAWIEKKLTSVSKVESDNTEMQISSIQITSDIPPNPRLLEKSMPLVSESPKLVAPSKQLVSPKKAPHPSEVFSKAQSARFIEGSSRPTTHIHSNSSTQSPVKVLYAVPPLVPVCPEDVKFEDYADCLLDDADLALELSD